MKLESRIPVYTAYLDLYIKHQETYTWNTYTHAAKSTVDNATAYVRKGIQYLTSKPVTNEPPTNEGLIRDYVAEVKNRLHDANDPEQWLSLVDRLRSIADETFKLKSESTHESLSSLAFHGLADMILTDMAESEYGNNLVTKVASLTKQFNDGNTQRLTNPQNASAHIQTMDTACISLAKLSRIEFISDAYRAKLFPYIAKRKPEEISNITHSQGDCYIELHPLFGKWLYEREFQELTKISYEEFSKREIAKHQRDLERVKHEQERKEKVSQAASTIKLADSTLGLKSIASNEVAEESTEKSEDGESVSMSSPTLFTNSRPAGRPRRVGGTSPKLSNP